MIPLCEPALLGRELEYVSDCIKTGWISSSGDYVLRFERALAEYIGVEHAVACTSGTSALHVAMILAGVVRDEEVIVPTVTFIATVNPVRYVGAWPVFIDCDEYCNIDVGCVARFLGEQCEVRDGMTFNRATGRRVSAIIPVHVFGTSADMDAVLQLAYDYHLQVVEDATESLGSLYKGRKCGSLAPIACLSFNGNKIVTSGGGGAVVTDDAEVAERARFLTTQAKAAGIGYIHPDVGYNYRMNNLLAAVGLAQLETIEERLACKRRNFGLYQQALGPEGSERLVCQPVWSESNRWFYAYLCADKTTQERVIQACLAADIQVRPLWHPNHLQQPYTGMQSYRISRALDYYDRLVNLPCSVGLTEDQVAQVATVVRAADGLERTHRARDRGDRWWWSRESPHQRAQEDGEHDPWLHRTRRPRAASRSRLSRRRWHAPGVACPARILGGGAGIGQDRRLRHEADSARLCHSPRRWFPGHRFATCRHQRGSDAGSWNRRLRRSSDQ
jgi:perosamine synthetase